VPPGADLLIPLALLLTGALASWFAGAGGLRTGRVAAAGGAWLALAALLLLWTPARAAQELRGPDLGAGAFLSLRLDAASFAFGLAVLVPVALLLTFQPRGWRHAGAAALASTTALVAVLADGLALAALALGSAATILLIQLRTDQPEATPGFWPVLITAVLCLGGAGAALEVASGTAAYAAVPVTAMGTSVFTLAAAGALLCSGVLPWRPWTAGVWLRKRLVAGSLAPALLVPAGFLVLLRTYEMGGGRWPSSVVSGALAVLGAAVALLAGARGQQAATRREHLAEAIPGLAGLALLSLALGTPVGVIAAIGVVLTAALLAALLPLLPEDRSAALALGVALAAGIPPSLAFAARLVAIQAAFEAGDLAAFLGVAAAVAWLLVTAGRARALRLPAQPDASVPTGSLAGAGLAGAALLIGGAAYGLLIAAVCEPAAAEAMRLPPAAISGAPLEVVTGSGAWPAVALGLPTLVLVVVALGFFGRVPAASPLRSPAPFFVLPGGDAGRRLALWAGGLRLPEQYRSLFNPTALEAAMGRGQPVLWVVLALVLAVAINR
jgi:hypothetical protein